MTVSGNGYQGVLATSELLLTQNKPLEKAVSQIERNLPRQSFEGCNDYDQVNRCPLCTSNMAKGRTFVPSKEKEGNWFSTRGWPRTLDVTKPQEKRVASPPTNFKDKHETPFRRFAFSMHDNRHAFQDQGEYFGNGLGRRTFPDRCQHYSSNLITWNANNDARSCYMASYQGSQGEDNSRNRRFPRVHPEAKPGSAPLETTTTKWFRRPDIPYKTPLHVLAITQEPFLTPNNWAYSYRPIWH